MSISKLLGFDWSIHGDGRSIKPGSFVAPNERLAWPITIGIGAQRGGSIDLTECARVGRERGRDTYPGQGQGAGERKRQHN